MTYLELKALSWEQLTDLLIRQAKVYHDAPNYAARLDPPPDLPAPTLALLGDFEIRARFLDHRREELETEKANLAFGTHVTRYTDHEGRERIVLLAGDYETLISRAYPVSSNRSPHDAVINSLSLYEELIYAVARKFPGETRHQTALRYIREAEARAIQGPVCDASPRTPEQWLPSGSDQAGDGD